METVPRRFAMRLKRLRKAKRWTQVDLAHATGLSPGYIARRETRRHDPKFSTLVKIAKVFKVQVGDLL